MAHKDVIDYYNNIAATYDESRFSNSYGRFIDAQERRVLDKLLPHADEPKKVLEMACGTGRLTAYATHALDASSQMIAIAKQKHPDVQFTLVSATDTGLPSESFDAVYAFHLMMHLDKETITSIITEASRLLKPGGQLIFDIPSKKRRKLLHHSQQGWHGATHLTTAEVKQMAAPHFQLKRSFGIMMLPVHKLPKSMRKALTSVDYAIANSPLKPYSSYVVYQLIKQ